jgi:hypothetical protein
MMVFRFALLAAGLAMNTAESTFPSAVPATTGARCAIPHVSPRQIGSAFGRNSISTDVFDISLVFEKSERQYVLGWLYTTGSKAKWFEPSLRYGNAKGGSSISGFEDVESFTNPSPGTAIQVSDINGREITTALMRIALVRGLKTTDAMLPPEFRRVKLLSSSIALEPCFSQPWKPTPEEVGSK